MEIERYKIIENRKSEKEAIEELHNVIGGNYLSKIVKRIYKIEDVNFIYTPYVISEYNIISENTFRENKHNKLFISTNIISGRNKVFDNVEGLKTISRRIEKNLVVDGKVDFERLKKELHNELLLRILPKTFRSWQNYQIRDVNHEFVYRPSWLIKWSFAKKIRSYQIFGDQYNL